MASVTDIVNVGLRMVGGTRITSLTDGTKNANVANDIYDAIRDDMLRSHPWNFATKRTTLARSSTTPTFEFTYAYALPSDWLRTVSLHDNDAGTGTLFYREEEVANQGVILSSVETVYCRYIYTATDPNRMPPDFRMALSATLAIEFASAISNSNTKIDLLMNRASRLMGKAKSADAQGSFPEQRPIGSWVRSRGGWRDSWPNF